MSAGLLRTTQHEFPVLDRDGHFQGMVTRDAIFHASAKGGPVTAAEAMARDIPAVGLHTPLNEVLDTFGQGAAPAVAVTGPDGAFLGYITRENLGEYMILNRPHA
jgi:stage IV sporulation protein FB